MLYHVCGVRFSYDIVGSFVIIQFIRSFHTFGAGVIKLKCRTHLIDKIQQAVHAKEESVVDPVPGNLIRSVA